MFKKTVTTIPATRAIGFICVDCPLKGQGMNQKQFCSFYKKSHDSDRPTFCQVESIVVTEGLGPVKLYNKNNEPVDSGCPGNEGKT